MYSEEQIMAFVDGELEPQMSAELEAAATADAHLQARIAAARTLRAQLRAAFDPVLREPVPTQLLQLVRASAAPRNADTVVNMRRAASPRRVVWQAVALAASVLAGVLLGHWVLRTGSVGPVVTHGGRLVARGRLARALSAQLASTQSATATVRIGISFRSQAGEYCRTFSLPATALAGLACRGGGRWQVQVLTRAEPQPSPAAAYREAASPLPAAVLAVVRAQIAGSPLDARAEAAAQRQGWVVRPGP